ncbi:MAG: hypothetical protein ACR2QW_00890 [bacterium]
MTILYRSGNDQAVEAITDGYYRSGFIPILLTTPHPETGSIRLVLVEFTWKFKSKRLFSFKID